MTHVADRLLADMDRTGSIACVGLDPRPDLLPPGLRREMLHRYGDTNDAVAAAFVEFNQQIIDAVAGRCAAVKPQAACYEAYGAAGWQALVETVAAAREAGIAVIVDAKRGDIGSTSAQYRQAFFGGAPGLGDGPAPAPMRTDWLTVNPYLGWDNVGQFLDPVPGGTGVFVLAKTSNPSSGELQDRRLAAADVDVAPAPEVAADAAADADADAGPDGADGVAGAGPSSVAEAVARLIHRWGTGRAGASGLTDVGAVVGATYPDDARALRALMPDTVFLVPGYGAQGGSAADAVAGARPEGRGVLVSSSRAIIAAWRDTPGDAEGRAWADAARAALDAMNHDLAAAHR